MTKVKCGVIRDLLPLVTDDVATADSKELVEEHLQECGYCRGYLEGMTVQLAKLPEEPPTDTSFIRFCRRMEKKFRLRKLLIGLLILVVAAATLLGGALLVDHKTNIDMVEMPIDWASAQVYQESDGMLGVLVEPTDGHSWYGRYGMNRIDDVMYIYPLMPAWRLFAQKNDVTYLYMNDVYVEEDSIFEFYNEYDVVYDETAHCYVDQVTTHRLPIRHIRWGTPDNYVTIYTEGDGISYFAEITKDVELGWSDGPVVIYRSEPRITPAPDMPVETDEPVETLEPETQTAAPEAAGESAAPTAAPEE